MQNTEISAPGPQTQPWRQACDCVVILQSPVSEKHPTGFLSDVTRFFAAQSRVIKVLPDLKRKTYAFAATEDPNVELLRVYRFAGPVQHGLINEALVSRRLMRPALYLDNWRFFSFYIKRFAGLKILALKETVTAVDEHVFHRMTLCSDVVIYGSEALANEHINATGCGNARLRVPWLEQYYDEAFYPGYLTRPEPPETPGRSQAGTIQEALDALNGLLNRAAGEAPRRSSLDILMLCDRKSMFTNTVREYIEAFRAYSGNSYTFADAREDFCYDNRSFGFTRELDAYDAVVIHFTVRQCFAESMSANYVRAFKQYGGYKVLMIQDDYDLTEKARKRIEELGVHEVFTPVPEAGIPKVYPPERFPGVK